jgi:hypothetical protein
MIRYPLHDLNCDDFERLVVLICHYILGPATIPFAKGKDGGRDGKFNGKANCIPSQANPWNGKIIIQAKHTVKMAASCSDSEFNTILKTQVIPAVNSLKDDDSIDYYLLFTNRKLTGIKDAVIEKQINDETQIPTILFAEEKIQDFLQLYPEVVRAAELNRLLLPFEYDESDLRDVILALNEHLKSDAPISSTTSFAYPGLENKNKLNQLGKQYFDTVMKGSMDDFERIKNFLSDSMNDELLSLYEDATNELNAKITLHRDQFYEFEQVIETCYDKIVHDEGSKLKGKKKLVRTLLHYMYCNCDIGKKS